MQLLRSLVRAIFESQQNQIRVLQSLGTLHSRSLSQRLQTIQILWEAEYSVFSQWGEDGILDFLVSTLEIERPNYIDFGAGDVRFSNGRWLLESRGGAGVFVDARKDLKSTLYASGLPVSTDSRAIETYLTLDNASDVFKEAASSFKGDVDVFSLDVDGQDYWILKSLEDLNAKIVLVEYQSYLGHELAITVPPSLNFDRTKSHFSWIYYGASLLAFCDLLELKGCRLVGTNHQRGNAFFVRKDLYESSSLNELLLPTLQDLCSSQGGESRSKSGAFMGLQGGRRAVLVEEMPWHNCRSGKTATLANHMLEIDDRRSQI